MQNPVATIAFRPLVAADLPMLREWMQRPHVAEWWPTPAAYEQFVSEYLPLTSAESTTRGFIALLDGEPIGFVQSYVAMGSGDGWWEEETDPGTRGIDQFLADADQLNRGLGTLMVSAFVERLFEDPAVTRVQLDPAPHNRRAVRCYAKAGFVACGEITTPDGAALLMVRERLAR